MSTISQQNLNLLVISLQKLNLTHKSCDFTIQPNATHLDMSFPLKIAPSYGAIWIHI